MSDKNRSTTFRIILFSVIIINLLFGEKVHLYDIFGNNEIKSTITKFEEGYSIAKVVDGDTIKVGKDSSERTIRLLQVDTPETKHPNKNKNVAIGKDAKNFTEEFLKDKFVYLEYDVEKIDKYGRDLAYVYIKDDKGNYKCLNEELVRNGLARVKKYGKNIKRYDQYKKIEEEVKSKKIGIWKDITSAYPD